MPLARAQAALEGRDIRLVFVDDSKAGQIVNGHATLSFDAFCAEPSAEKAIAVAIADPATRRRLVGKCNDAGLAPLSVTASGVVIMDDVQIGPGALLSPGVVITSNIRIGAHFHGNIHSIVEHDCMIGDFVTFAPGVRCNGAIHIGDGAYIGAGAVIRHGTAARPVRIGAGAVIGMGAVVLSDVPDGVTVVGNPARMLASNR
jgi:sugar O-acyltransferase (sialic acid O-acetyltransferase NeuD family)